MVADTEAVNGATATETPQPIEIGREFIRQYYTMLAENPDSVFRFYSHESTYDHNGTEARGQAKIQQAIESLKPEFYGSKVRIHDIKGAHSADKSILLQVCGVLDAPGESKSRSFVQAVVLVQQTAKKFFVLNDIFQYVDQALNDTQTSATPSSINNNVADVEKPKVAPGNQNVNGTVAPVQNGHTTANIVKPQGLKTEERERTPLEAKDESHPPAPLSQPPSVETRKKIENEEKQSDAVAPEVNVAPAEPVKPQETAPVSWAGKVRQGTAPTKEAPRPAVVQQQAAPRPVPPKDNEFVPKTTSLYLGNILRNMVPDSNVTAENELRSIFEKFGAVESVFVPKKALELPNDTTRLAFAFITMKTLSDAAAVFRHAQKDQDRNSFGISLKIDAFGFEGVATLSEQQKRDGPFQGGRGGGRGGGINQRGGGSFVPRGGRGGYSGRGGPRGGFSNAQ